MPRSHISHASLGTQPPLALPPIPTPLAPSRDTFIYEYVGDVVNSPSFYKRMRQYAEEGIRHFYFMMLQKDEVCLPASLYSYVRKWA